MFKKSQAALEFLTTYAWAFLVILIMVAALAYFGILSPNKLLPDRCVFGTDLGCEDYQLTDGAAGTIKVTLRNNLPENINVAAGGFKLDSTMSLVCSGTSAAVSDWTSDTEKEFTLTGCGMTAATFMKGDKAKIKVTLSYSQVGSAYLHEVAGEIFSTVIATPP